MNITKPDKAQITYQVSEGKEQVLRFHTVVAEEHEVTNELTKFPIQDGFLVSNHAIKRNRKVVIHGVVSNHLIIGSEEFHEYGGKNTRIMFTALKDLIRQATPCDVTTNLDKYSPVIFTRMKTKQQAGSTDILDFTLVGEEVQLANTNNQTTPTLLSFTVLTEEQRKARVDELVKAGLEEPPETAVISQATFDPNESFQVESTGANGKKFIMTYEKKAYDPSSNSYSHLVHTSDTDVGVPTEQTEFSWTQLLSGDLSALPDVALPTGANTVSACVSDGAIGLVNQIGEDFISTSLGRLRQTTYGAAYGAFGVNSNKGFGQVLLALGTECLVAGAVNLTEEAFEDSSLPTVSEVIKGAVRLGQGLSTEVVGIPAPSVLTKISESGDTTSFFGEIQ